MYPYKDILSVIGFLTHTCNQLSIYEGTIMKRSDISPEDNSGTATRVELKTVHQCYRFWKGFYILVFAWMSSN